MAGTGSPFLKTTSLIPKVCERSGFKQAELDVMRTYPGPPQNGVRRRSKLSFERRLACLTILAVQTQKSCQLAFPSRGTG